MDALSEACRYLNARDGLGAKAFQERPGGVDPPLLVLSRIGGSLPALGVVEERLRVRAYGADRTGAAEAARAAVSALKEWPYEGRNIFNVSIDGMGDDLDPDTEEIRTGFVAAVTYCE